MINKFGQSDISPAEILDMETKISNNGKCKDITE